MVANSGLFFRAMITFPSAAVMQLPTNDSAISAGHARVIGTVGTKFIGARAASLASAQVPKGQAQNNATEAARGRSRSDSVQNRLRLGPALRTAIARA